MVLTVKQNSYIHDSNSNVRLSSSFVAAIGGLMVTTGCSIISLTFGALTYPYFLVLIAALGLMVPHIISQVRIKKRETIVLFILLSAQVLIFLLQGLFLYKGELSRSDFVYVTRNVAVLVLAYSLASLPKDVFTKLMKIIATSHLVILATFIPRIRELFLQSSLERFATENFATAVWAEVALGTVAAALLARSNLALVLSLMVGGLFIAATQMRGAGLSIAFAILSIGLFYRPRQVMEVIAVLCLVGIAFSGVLLKFDVIAQSLSEALMLDDPHRGISSGFSGRFDNILAGFQVFLQNPIVGVGGGNSDGNYTHNGVVMSLAQNGILVSLFFIFLACWAAVLSFRSRDARLFAVILAYGLFIQTAPRYLNIQVFPFLGIVAIAFSLVHRKNLLENSSPK